jgi:aminoglycoside phosphotransferase (APT) family kinase protein
MPVVKMHAGERETDVSLVRRLLQAQFPQWADLPIKPVTSAGTDNAIYRLGDDLAVRLPRIDWAVGQVEKDCQWLPKLAPHLPLDIPIPLAMGKPGEGYPWHWGVYQWLDGENTTIDHIPDPRQAAIDLAQFITALQQIDSTDGPLAVDHQLRGVPLARHDVSTRRAIKALNGMFDTKAVTVAWNATLQASEWERAPVWFHGDLLPGNLLFERGRLSAIIDFSGLGVGDPACDLMIAWGLFSGESREVFRTALAVDDATWARGRGQALSQALIFIPYYLDTNPVGVSNARRAIEEILADFRQNE